MKTKNKNTRLKVVLQSPIADRHEAEAIVGEITNITLNRIRLVARLDAAVNAIVEQGRPALDECAAQLEAKTDALRVWAEANPKEFPKGRKSIKFAGGVIGFRDGTPKLALLNRSWTWAKALEAVKGWLPNFIRDAPEIDKEALIAQRAENIIAETLPKCGLKVTSDTSFFVDPNVTDVEKRQIVQSEAA